MIFSILELVTCTCLKLGGHGYRVDHEPRGHEEKKFGNHCPNRYIYLTPIGGHTYHYGGRLSRNITKQDGDLPSTCIRFRVYPEDTLRTDRPVDRYTSRRWIITLLQENPPMQIYLNKRTSPYDQKVITIWIRARFRIRFRRQRDY